MTSYDSIIIGTGQAGPTLAGRLTDSGEKVAIIERKLFGGTCVNTGCTPTKALVASAYAAHIARRAADYGVTLTGPVTVDMKRVKARKDAIAGQSSQGLEEWLKGMDNCDVYQGHARFIGPKNLRIALQSGDAEIKAEKIFLNVGGRARIPDLPGLDEVDYWTNSSMMEVDFLPRHLLILGGSYIGLEFAQMYRRFGSDVTVIEHGPHLVPREDEDVSQTLREILEGEGIRIVTDSKAIGVAGSGGGIAVRLETAAGETEVAGSNLLVAIGRVPNTDDLGLEHTGVQRDRHGYIEVDDQLRTKADGIWAMGDCNGRGAFTHTAYNDFEIVAANLLDNDPRRVTDRFPVYALYTDPPLGRAGINKEQARQSGKKVLHGHRPMTKVARAKEKGETAGFMEILVDAETKKILGATILGTGGDEAIHTIIDVMNAGAPYTAIQRAVHIHPTVSELIPTMLGELKPLDS